MHIGHLVALALVYPALALAAEGPNETPAHCAKGTWQLEGAPTGSEADASFSPAWIRELTQVADCMKRPELANTCVTVQGRYDDMAFDGAVSQALGGEIPAQILRARGRALRVLSWLYDAGVDPQRIQERPPPSRPSFRGVYVALLPKCLPVPAEPVVVTPLPPDPAQIRVVVEQALDARGAPTGGGPTEVHLTVPPPVDVAGPWWIGVSSAGVGLFADGVDDVFAAEARLGVGWSGQHTYARFDTGLAFGTDTAQDTGLATGLGAGWRALEWLEVGARVGHRISGADFLDPYADQVFYGAVESTQCLDLDDAGLQACLEEILGGGQLSRRAVEVRDTLYFVPEEDHAVLVFGMLLSLRQGL